MGVGGGGWWVRSKAMEHNLELFLSPTFPVDENHQRLVHFQTAMAQKRISLLCFCLLMIMGYIAIFYLFFKWIFLVS